MNITFRTSARTVDLLGRQQIAGIPTAIQELVKNAYDAYAKRVDIDYFEESNSLVISDDGCGMTADDFVKKWLTLGTSSRVTEATKGTYEYEKRKKLGRPVTGEKGIGRLAIASIGRMVLIVSRAKINSELTAPYLTPFVVAAIHWGQFELPYITLDKIEVPVQAFQNFPSSSEVIRIYDNLWSTLIKSLSVTGDAKKAQEAGNEIEKAKACIEKILPLISLKFASGTGTAFIISAVDSTFASDVGAACDVGNDDVPVMMQTLTGFADPLRDKSEGQTMHIGMRLHKPDGRYISFLNTNDFFTKEDLMAADHRFIGRFDEDGKFTGDIYIYGEKVAERHIIDCSRNCKGVLKCGPFDLALGYLQGNQRQSALDPIKHEQLQLKLKRFGGLYIYRDGVRLLPYGRSDYDFLGLEADRIKSASRYFFSYHRMFGSIAITREDNGLLTEKAGREGLIENSAYRQFKTILKNFFQQVAHEFFSNRDGTNDSAQRFWSEHRHQLELAAEIAKKNERALEQKRKSFCKKLGGFFKKLESGMYKKEVDAILDNLVEALYGGNGEGNEVSAVTGKEIPKEALLRLQKKAIDKIWSVERSLLIKYPVGVSLAVEQREDWNLYLKESERIQSEVIEPAKGRVAKIIYNYAQKNPEQVSMDSLVQSIVEDSLTSASSAISRRFAQTATLIDDLKKRFEDWKMSVELEYGGMVNTALNCKLQEDESSDLNKAVEKRLRPPSEKADTIVHVTDYLKGMLIPINWNCDKDGRVVTTQEVLSALNEENQDLKSQRLSDVELIQLGLAAKAFHHEFNGAVLQARAAIKDLEEIAANDSHCKPAVKTLSSSFEHLEQYISMITPFASRIETAKEQIGGMEIFKFLCEAFKDRLKTGNIVVETSQGFLKNSMVGHRSIYLPVVFNLVDNAIYWLMKSDIKGRRVILLHATSDGRLSVSNNGVPIPFQDRERIFNMGFTRKVGGRGMGLAISREILQADGVTLVCIDPIRSDMNVTFEIRPFEKKD